jgi:hypothetical protein
MSGHSVGVCPCTTTFPNLLCCSKFIADPHEILNALILEWNTGANASVTEKIFPIVKEG